MIAVASFVILLTSTIVYVRKFWLKEKKIDTTGKIVLITGCDSGFGLASALRLHDIGLRLIVTCLNNDSVGAKQLKKLSNTDVYILNLRNCTEIEKFIIQLKDTFKGGIWAIVNNAGIGTPGELLSMSVKHAKNIFQRSSFRNAAIQLWNDLEDEKRSLYNEQDFFKRFENMATNMDKVSEINLNPVIEAIENAVTSLNPKIRYPVGKGARIFNIVYSSLPVNLQFKLRKFTSTTRN
ncbi:DgyrCDS8986 [Dimorphilus gyrociliatus]|uniref:DgyrCDS8986 n=1 Tax=Dimorphilus gyrociliatus TaxID=2664684 RepID=A0A7I8VX05_9ANNE|nr:DgyrCDS8986 [Dimorphilus gyrociliatus]